MTSLFLPKEKVITHLFALSFFIFHFLFDLLVLFYKRKRQQDGQQSNSRGEGARLLLAIASEILSLLFYLLF